MRRVFEIDNNIHIFINDKNEVRLRYHKYNIETKAHIGRNGVTIHKQEGDGKTPLGEFELGIILGTHTNVGNKNGLKYKQITENLYWVDDIKSIYYNQLVDLATTTKDWKSAEHLIDYPIQYEYLVEIKTNPENIPPKGSAIFLHCTNNKPTAGCIAIDRNVMKKIIENIDKNTKIKIKKC